MNMPNPRLHVFPILLLIWAVICTTSAYGAPAANLWPHWQNHDAHSLVIVDHVDWNLILQRYVDANHPSGINRFKYSSISQKDRLALKSYLQKMQKMEVSSLNRNEQKAYWINLYNALTVDIIVDHYPVKSIRDIDISPGLFSNGPWDAKLLKIEEQEVSLNDIEHRILRPIWQDNRIHYAVNCASLGCPNLLPQAYTSQNFDMLIEKAATDFINHPRGVSFTRNRLQVSSIYFWFQADFGDSEKGVIRHLKTYLSPEKVKQLNSMQKKMGHRYDWNLNE